MGQGYVFTCVCDSVHGGGYLGRYPPGRYTPPPAGTPPAIHAGIRSTSGRYASYWNAFLLKLIVFPVFEINYAADGKVSRMSMIEGDLSDEEVELGIVRDDGRGSGLSTPDPDQAFVQQHLR